STLYEVGYALSSTLDFHQVLQSITRLAATALRARTAILRLAVGETAALRRGRGSGLRRRRWATGGGGPSGKGASFDSGPPAESAVCRARGQSAGVGGVCAAVWPGSRGRDPGAVRPDGGRLRGAGGIRRDRSPASRDARDAGGRRHRERAALQ